MKTDNRNLLLFGISEKDADLYYATRFLAPDPFLFIQIRGKKYLFMSDLEVDRARAQATADRVFSVSKLRRHYHQKHGRWPGLMDLAAEFLRKLRVKRLDVPAGFPLAEAEILKRRGFKISPQPEPLFPQRMIKTPAEICLIRQTLRHTESAFGAALQILKRSAVKNGRLYLGKKILTSEDLKRVIRLHLMERGCLASRLIVSCGKDTADPHHEGTGPLLANKPIIFDIFPQNLEHQYWGDFTRTVVRGRASDKLKKIYAAVRKAQTIALRALRHGADGAHVHELVLKHFEEQGFSTSVRQGRMQGFFHSTGHGLGLEIHELPRIGLKREILQAGQVVTVEPGLYYRDEGGVRLEDVVVITKTGCKNLTRFPKILEL